MTCRAVADVVETDGPSEIHRADQERVAMVSANLRDGDLGTAVHGSASSMVRENPLGAGVAPAHRRPERGARQLGATR